ncbi:hypothetical protein GCM10019017_07540 [Streptomyces showdoensis]
MPVIRPEPVLPGPGTGCATPRPGYTRPEPGGPPPRRRGEQYVLMAHPAVLRELIEQYETLMMLKAENGGEEVRRRMDDLAYTLCVSTGTRDVDAALIAARHRLPGARPEDDSVLSA